MKIDKHTPRDTHTCSYTAEQLECVPESRVISLYQVDRCAD